MAHLKTKMKTNLALLALVVGSGIIFSGSAALKCIECTGNGTSCRDQGSSKTCPAGSDVGRCGRATFILNGVKKVRERCVEKDFCVGTINCSKDGFELSKRYPGASNCVVSCCEGDDCDQKPPLKCYRCTKKGETCSTNSVSCGFGEDRCIRVNFVVNGTIMVSENCFQSSLCSNTTAICQNFRNTSGCRPVCCEGDNCNDDTSTPSPTPTSHSKRLASTTYLVMTISLILVLEK